MERDWRRLENWERFGKGLERFGNGLERFGAGLDKARRKLEDPIARVASNRARPVLSLVVGGRRYSLY